MTSRAVNDPWLLRPRTKGRASLRLFCFPYAGGDARIFEGWQDALPEFAEVCPVLLPGRGRRMQESPYTRLVPLVEALTEALVPYLDKPFAFFGHSMGALVSFELARHLRREHGLEASHLFLSARPAPQLEWQGKSVYDLPEPELIKILFALNGTPTEIFEHPSLLQLILPAIRADFEVVQTHIYKADFPLNCPFTIFGGVNDPKVSRDDLEAWWLQTTGAFTVRMLPGDHFFLNTSQTRLLNLIGNALQQCMK